MRQKVAKALRREAQKFAEQHDRTADVYTTIGRKKKITIVMPALLPNGKRDEREIEVVRTQDVLSDGPRYFYRQLKKAFRRGKLTRIEVA